MHSIGILARTTYFKFIANWTFSVTLAKKKICDFALSLIFFLFFKGRTRLNSRAVGTRGAGGRSPLHIL